MDEFQSSIKSCNNEEYKDMMTDARILQCSTVLRMAKPAQRVLTVYSVADHLMDAYDSPSPPVPEIYHHFSVPPFTGGNRRLERVCLYVTAYIYLIDVHSL